MLVIIQIICTYFMITYALSPKRSPLTRVLSLGMVVITWFVPFGYIPGMIWGALCWSDARAGGH
jgi:hypothetical protein